MSARSFRRLSLALCAIGFALLVPCIFSFFHITPEAFEWHGQPWHFVFRGGEICIDNEPQRTIEYGASCEIVAREHEAWEIKHMQFLTEMEHSPYGPEYTAARLRMDAWEAVNGIRWTKWPTPTSPHVEHRFQFLWLVALLAAPWIALQLKQRASAERTSPIRRLVMRTAVVLMLVAIAVVWFKSYRMPLEVCIYTPRSIYTASTLRGRVAVGLPPTVDATKYAEVEEIVRRIRTDDIEFLVGPMNIAPPGRPVQVRQTVPVATKPSGYVMVTRISYIPQFGPAHYVAGITATIHRDSPFERLRGIASTPEVQTAMTEALLDPNRYVAAHVFISERLPRGLVVANNQSFPIPQISNAHYSDSTFAGLKIALTPAQARHAKPNTMDQPIVPLNIVPGQMPALQKKWHHVLDRRTRAVSLGWTTPILLLPIYWAIAAWRNHRGRSANQCAKCGYNLTGNASGVCPECGTAVASMKDAAPGATV